MNRREVIDEALEQSHRPRMSAEQRESIIHTIDRALAEWDGLQPTDEEIECAARAAYEAEWDADYDTATEIERALAQQIARAALVAVYELKGKT